MKGGLRIDLSTNKRGKVTMRKFLRRSLIAAGAGMLLLAFVATAQAAAGGDRSATATSKSGKVAAKGQVTAIGKRVIVVKRGSGHGVRCRYKARMLPSWVEKGARVTLVCKGRKNRRQFVDIRGRGSWKARQNSAETEVKGTITELVAPSKSSEGHVAIAAGASAITCTIPQGGLSLEGFAVGDTVEAKCRLLSDLWTLTRIKHEDDIGPGGGGFVDDEVEMHGFIDMLTAPGADTPGSIEVAAGGSAISCTIPAGSLLTPGFATGELVEAKCELVGGEWTLTRIEHEDSLPTGGGPVVGDDEIEVTATIDTLTQPGASSGSISAGGTTCVIPAGSQLAAGFGVGDLVEIKCERFAGEWVLTRIRSENSPSS